MYYATICKPHYFNVKHTTVCEHCSQSIHSRAEACTVLIERQSGNLTSLVAKSVVHRGQCETEYVALMVEE